MSTQQPIGILYVDDEALALKYFSEMLQDKATVLTANNPERGLELFIENQDKIGVVLSDKNMPGMTGFELLKKIRAINDAPLRILVTAYKDLGEAVESLNEGLVHSYLTKPWDPEEMCNQMQKTLDLFWIKQQKTKILRDRTTMFQEMLMAEKVSSIESLSIGFSQQISKSLGAIRSYFENIPSQLSQELGANPPKDDFFWNEYYSSIGKQIDRIDSIFSGLTNCTNSNQLDSDQKITVEPGINLAKMISEVGSARTSKYTKIDFATRGELEIEIEGEPAKLLRLFSNLFSESILNFGKDESGSIDITIEEDNHSDGSKGLSIYFNDDGEILTQKQKQHLFDPFFLRSDRDSKPGLSLLTCYIIAYQHGGYIEPNASNQVRENSIHLWLPLIYRQPTQTEASRNFLDSLI